jgi:hypothetical protein
VHLQFSAERARVRIAVYDGSTVLPKPREAAAHDECGRGLGIVRALSDSCGVADDRLGVLAKWLWFELDTGRAVA